MPSPEHEALRARITELSTNFVDFDIPLDRDPSSRELDMIASFKLLAHAEFETFIEIRVKDTINKAVSSWKTSKIVNIALFGLLMRWYPWFEQDRNPFSSPQPRQKVTEMLEIIAQRAIREIEENNGIKSAAFSRLCLSAGILSDDLSPLLLAALESYGKLRGDVAHNSVGRVKTLNDPRSEAGYAKQIVELLDQFDQQLAVAAP